MTTGWIAWPGLWRHCVAPLLPEEGGLDVMQMRRVWRPPTDVFETESEIVVKVEIAGMREQDFEISFVDRRLVIQGHRQDPEGKIIYQNMEIRYGDFYTAVQLNLPLDASAIEATYREGFLFVHLPKAQEHRVRVSSQVQDRAE